jgi:hypothetical protein
MINYIIALKANRGHLLERSVMADRSVEVKDDRWIEKIIKELRKHTKDSQDNRYTE